jgi:hypothetical protein
MNRNPLKKIAIFFAFSVASVALTWIPLSRSIAWRQAYTEAEPLVHLVWPMASEMKRFSVEKGRLPASLEEMVYFSNAYDFSRLRVYHPKFSQNSDRPFYLEVNSRFAFEIDKTFTPKWSRCTDVFGVPPDS